MTQNVPFIVAQHLNTVKHNTSAIRGLAQLASWVEAFQTTTSDTGDM
jgi:hypothetical protein